MAGPGNKVLLIGATGYIGGTVLDHLIKSTEPSISNLTFDVLVRKKEQAQKLQDTYKERVNPILWAGLDDTTSVADTASNYDVILNAGFGFHPPGAKAFVDGLARRIGKPGVSIPWLVHMSGCTNLADRPFTHKAYPGRVWNDADAETAYEYMKAEDARDPYPQRTAEVGVLTVGHETGVQVVSLNTPYLFGQGTGLFFTKHGSNLLPLRNTMRFVVQHGYGLMLNDTSSFSYVHIEDLADVFVLLLRTILEREDRGVGYIPSGKRGIIFPAVGSWLAKDIFQHCLDAAFEARALPRDDTPQQKEVRLVSLQEMTDAMLPGVEATVALALAERSGAGHMAQNGTVARRLLRWMPTRLEEAWKRECVEELAALRTGARGVMLGGCINMQVS